MLFFAETFQQMNAALTFQIGLNDSARSIGGKFTFAGVCEGFWGIRTICLSGRLHIENIQMLEEFS